jgi:lipoate-protein ligase A
MNPPGYPAGTWRLLVSSPADGATNMAIDEAILRAVSRGLVRPTLRLYAWQPPCLSLGRGQRGTEVDQAACARDGLHVVRRPTGGRAILHTDELTYSVVAPLDEPRVAGDIVTSYRRLSRALLAALRRLGVDAESHLAATEEPGAEAPNPVCFEVPSHYELTAADGRKLVGSAQMRTSEVVLQHGTLPLEGDIARICRYVEGGSTLERVRARAATLEGALGRRVEWDEAAAAVVAGFSTALNLTFERDELTSEEQSWMAELRGAKYAKGTWTWRL